MLCCDSFINYNFLWIYLIEISCAVAHVRPFELWMESEKSFIKCQQWLMTKNDIVNRGVCRNFIRIGCGAEWNDVCDDQWFCEGDCGNPLK